MSRMYGAIPPLPLYVFMAWCLVKHRDFTLLTVDVKRELIGRKRFPTLLMSVVLDDVCICFQDINSFY